MVIARDELIERSGNGQSRFAVLSPELADDRIGAKRCLPDTARGRYLDFVFDRAGASTLFSGNDAYVRHPVGDVIESVAFCGDPCRLG
jgi:hypothetical protein